MLISAGLRLIRRVFSLFRRRKEAGEISANYKSAYKKRSLKADPENQVACIAGLPSEAWSVYASIHNDAEEAEFRIAEGCPCSSYQRY
jgi:hypothetical protein